MESAGPSNTPFWKELRERQTASERALFPEGDRAAAPFFSLQGLWEDTRYGLQLMRKNLGLSSAVTLTLALGIGLTVAVLTLINGMGFRARVDEPGNFVQVTFPNPNQTYGPALVSPQEYVAYRDRTRSLRSLAAAGVTHVILGHDRSTEVTALMVSCNFFEVYHLRQARMGRLFASQECAEPGGAPVAVLSEEAWRDRFGSDPNIVGSTIQIEDRPFTVVGIVPAHHPARVSHGAVWIPYTAQPLLGRGDIFRARSEALTIGGRLAPGMSYRSAQAEWELMVGQLDREHPGRKTVVKITDGSTMAMINTGSTKFYALFVLLMSAPWALLLITCANVHHHAALQGRGAPPGDRDPAVVGCAANASAAHAVDGELPAGGGRGCGGAVGVVSRAWSAVPIPDGRGPGLSPSRRIGAF